MQSNIQCLLTHDTHSIYYRHVKMKKKKQIRRRQQSIEWTNENIRYSILSTARVVQMKLRVPFQRKHNDKLRLMSKHSTYASFNRSSHWDHCSILDTPTNTIISIIQRLPKYFTIVESAPNLHSLRHRHHRIDNSSCETGFQFCWYAVQCSKFL